MECFSIHTVKVPGSPGLQSPGEGYGVGVAETRGVRLGRNVADGRSVFEGTGVMVGEGVNVGVGFKMALAV